MVWYTTGSASITNGSTTVTGTGTAFLTNCRIGDGITFASSSAIYQITNIASETQLTITPAYSGTTQTNGAFAVVPVQGYQKDLADQVRALLLTYGTIAQSPSLAAFSMVTGGTDLLAYFTSATSMTTTSFTPFARTVMDDVDASSMQNTIGVYSKTSTYNKTEVDNISSTINSSISTKADKDSPILTGNPQAPTPTPGDNDTSIATTAFVAASFAKKGANSDITSLSGLTTVLSVGQGGTGVNTTDAQLTSLITAGAYAKSNIIGTVSQTSGVPTGGIIETGTNSNGTYIKYADGSMLCYYLITYSSVQITTSTGSMWYGVAAAVQQYPATFSAIPTTLQYFEASGNMWSGSSSSSTATQWGGCFPLSDVSRTVTGARLNRIAIGRWY